MGIFFNACTGKEVLSKRNAIIYLLDRSLLLDVLMKKFSENVTGRTFYCWLYFTDASAAAAAASAAAAVSVGYP